MAVIMFVIEPSSVPMIMATTTFFIAAVISIVRVVMVMIMRMA